MGLVRRVRRCGLRGRKNEEEKPVFLPQRFLCIHITLLYQSRVTLGLIDQKWWQWWRSTSDSKSNADAKKKVGLEA